MDNPTVVFFSGRLLPPSETFILAQGQALKTFRPHYVGARRVPGLTLPEEQTWVLNQGDLWGKAQEGLFKLRGIAPQLTRKIKALNPSLIHAHFGVCGTLILPLMRSIQRPLVVTFYGLDATMTEAYAQQESVSTQMYLQRKDSLKQQTQLFIAVSDFIRDKLLEQGFPEAKVISHYYGVDTDTFTPDPSIPRERIVLFVGRLSEKKGCQYLIQAMAKVQSILEDVKLVIIGDGELRAELETQAQQSLKHYEFLGFQPSPVVKSWMNRVQIMAVPSVTATNGDSERLPTVVVEAQAMGLPVVGSFHAGIPQAVQHGLTGLLAAERDWNILADHIITLMQKPDQWQAFSHNGRDRMQNAFNLERQTEKLEDLYQKVMESWSAP